MPGHVRAPRHSHSSGESFGRPSGQRVTLVADIQRRIIRTTARQVLFGGLRDADRGRDDRIRIHPPRPILEPRLIGVGIHRIRIQQGPDLPTGTHGGGPRRPGPRSRSSRPPSPDRGGGSAADRRRRSRVTHPSRGSETRRRPGEASLPNSTYRRNTRSHLIFRNNGRSVRRRRPRQGAEDFSSRLPPIRPIDLLESSSIDFRRHTSVTK